MEFERLKVGMSECIGKTISETDILSLDAVHE